MNEIASVAATVASSRRSLLGLIAAACLLLIAGRVRAQTVAPPSTATLFGPFNGVETIGQGVAVNAAGAVCVASMGFGIPVGSGNLSTVTTTLSPSLQVTGNSFYPGNDFSIPSGAAIDPSGNCYVATSDGALLVNGAPGSRKFRSIPSWERTPTSIRSASSTAP